MLFLLICIYFFDVSMSIINSTGDFNKDSDNSTIIISLEGYNVSLPEGESFDSLHTLRPYSMSKIFVTKIPDDSRFVVLQVHSYLVNVTLSLDSVPNQNNSITSTNVGLLKMYRKTDLSFYLSYNSSSMEGDVMVSVQAYSKDAPIPGGCNMEFQVEISPFLLTTFDEDITEVNFAPSAPPRSVLSRPFLYYNSECNVKPSPVQYKMFHKYFPERDFTKETYFDVLKSMMTKGRIMKNGAFVREKLTGSPMKRFFATYPGTGNAFVVISYYENFTAVYVPSFTYGCNDLGDNNTCLVLTTTFSKVLCASILFMGLFACFFGHYFFTIEIFLFGFLIVSVITYILVSLLFSNTIALSTAVGTGVVIASLKLLACAIFRLPVVSVVLTTLTFGFLLASIIYYPLIDYVNLLSFDINFWGVFIGIVLICPILMIYLAEKANIISCAFLGSFFAIVSIDHYIGSNLRYIAINTIRRAVTDNFNLATIAPPFQYKDILLSFLWAFLMFSGRKVQLMLMKNKPPYPPPGNSRFKLFSGRRKPSDQPGEKSPLLYDRPSNFRSHSSTSNYPHYFYGDVH